MRQIKALLLMLTLGCVTSLANGDEPLTEPLPTLTSEQAKFLISLNGKWIPKEVLVGGKVFNEKVALTAVLVTKATFEFLDPNDLRTPFKCTRISAEDQSLDLVALVNEKPVRYLMKLDGKTMWLVTNANDKYEMEWTTKPTQYNLCILLERKPKEISQPQTK